MLAALTSAAAAATAARASARMGWPAANPATAAPPAAPPFMAEFSQAWVSVPLPRGAALAAAPNKVADSDHPAEIQRLASR